MAGERPWDVQVAVPDGWLVVTGDPATDPGRIRSQVEEAVPGRGRARRAARDGLAAALTTLSESAAASRAAAAALRWGQDPTFGLAMATMQVERMSRDPGPPAKALGRLRPELAAELPFDEYPPRVEEVDLGIGRALRMDAVRRPSDYEGVPQNLRLVVEYWVPVEEDEVVRMFFSTANLAMASDLTAEFHVIAANFSYRVEGTENP